MRQFVNLHQMSSKYCKSSGLVKDLKFQKILLNRVTDLWIHGPTEAPAERETQVVCEGQELKVISRLVFLLDRF